VRQATNCLWRQDVVVALVPEKAINNGQPSLHARCLALLDPLPGESVIHIGSGTGYVDALGAELDLIVRMRDGSEIVLNKFGRAAKAPALRGRPTQRTRNR
jgi:hypothetical protein